MRGVDPVAAPSSEVTAALAHLVLAATQRAGLVVLCVLSRFSRVRLCAAPWPMAHRAPVCGMLQAGIPERAAMPSSTPTITGHLVPAEAAEPVAGL